MALPTSPVWDLADFSGADFGTLLGLGPSDLTALPTIAPYYTYNSDLTVINARSSDGIEGSLQFSTPLPSRFTLDIVLRCPSLPHNLGDLTARRFGLTVADDAGRGFSIYLAKTGVAISRVDNYGAATALPDTSDVTAAVATSFFTIRVAVDGALGRAYVFVGEGATELPALRWVLPVDQTPATVGDVFKIFAKGTAAEPVFVEFTSLRLAGDLVIANYPPVADAGPDRVASVGSAVRFDGRASYDIENAPLTYKWTCIDAPYGSDFAADISVATSEDDGDADGVTAIITVSPLLLPDWLAVGDIVRLRGSSFEISSIDTGTGEIEVTSDNIPDDLTAEPIRFIRQSILLDRDDPTPTAVPDLPGLYRFTLVVNDGESDSEVSETLANITALRTPVGVEPEVSAIWKALGDDWRLIDGRNVFEEAWVGVSQILAGKLLEAWQYHYNTSIRDAQQTFQRKWIAYRTLISEPSPDEAEVSVRHGAFAATYTFEVAPAPTGNTLVIEILTADGTFDSIPVLLSTGTLPAIVSAINAATVSTPIVASAEGTRDEQANLRVEGTVSTVDDGDADGLTDYVALVTPAWVAAGDIFCFGGRRSRITLRDGSGITLATEVPDNLTLQPYTIYRAARLVIRGNVPFRLSGTARAPLGLPEGLNVLRGTGTRVTDRAYYVEAFDLNQQEVQRGDLLVLNNGESFRIDRIISDPMDPRPNQRVLLFDSTPTDSTATWDIPSVVRSAETDYEIAGTYPGDLVKTEIYTEATGQVAITNSWVVAQKETQLAVALGLEAHAAILADKELRFIGVKRRKAIPLPNDVLSVPALQEIIPESLEPTRFKEHVDYILEPFYRDTGGGPLPMIQFRDSVFLDPDAEPADVLWAETTLFDNEVHVENLFGRLVNFLRDDASTFPPDFNYVAGVSGLLYAQQRGPTLFAVAVGAQILLGQPFAEVAGYIEEIRADYSPQQGRVLIRDDDGKVPTESETVRAYYYTKDPLDLSATSGLAVNINTGAKWVTGDYVPQFSPIGSGVDIEDIYTVPNWWRSYVGSGSMYEVEKFHRFVCTFNVDLVSLANVGLLYSLLTRIKPTYTRAVLVGTHLSADDLDIDDTIAPTVTLFPYETLLGTNGNRYDDYRGDGTTSCLYDDGVSRYDALVDSILDIIEFEMTIEWPGGILDFPTEWPFDLDTDVVDVDGGETGVPGSTFSLVDGMNLAAGTYLTIVAIKSGPVLPPL